MLYSTIHGLFFPDFTVVTHNQRRCFDENESIIDPMCVKIRFLNQINGLINNKYINSKYIIDSYDGCYQCSPSGPDTFKCFNSDESVFVDCHKSIGNSVVKLSSLSFNPRHKRNKRCNGR